MQLAREGSFNRWIPYVMLVIGLLCLVTAVINLIAGGDSTLTLFILGILGVGGFAAYKLLDRKRPS